MAMEKGTKKAPVIPQHRMDELGKLCLISGHNPTRFGRENGLTEGQIPRLKAAIDKELVRVEEAMRASEREDGAILDDHQKMAVSVGAVALSALQRRGMQYAAWLELRANAHRADDPNAVGVMSADDLTKEAKVVGLLERVVRLCRPLIQAGGVLDVPNPERSADSLPGPAKHGSIDV